jgi:probable phosphoglycerate mutase
MQDHPQDHLDVPSVVDRPSFGSPLERAFLFDRADHGSLLLVRHGQQITPDRATPGDWNDPPLTDLGLRQIEAVAALLAGDRVDAVYASPLQRALRTGEGIAARHGLDVTVVPELEEVRLFGEVPAGSDITEVIPGDALRTAADRFVRERRWGLFPLSEGSEPFRARVGAAIESILAEHQGEHVVVACHGGVINAYLSQQLDLAADMFFRPAHCSVSRVAFDPELRVIRSLNEVHHLSDVLLSY